METNLICSLPEIRPQVCFENFVKLYQKLIFPGVYRRNRDIQVFIDVTQVVELRSHSIENQLIIGANVSLTETMDILKNASKFPGYEYCALLVKHIDLVATVPVRNV